MMNISILKYLPHRPPMQMVDTITHINDTSIVTKFLIRIVSSWRKNTLPNQA